VDESGLSSRNQVGSFVGLYAPLEVLA